MSDFDWKKTLGSIAPTIATAIGGPFAGTATKFLAEKFLGQEDASMDEVAEALKTANPETLAKIKQIDADFKTEMKALGIKEKELAFKDTADARNMAVNTSLVPQIVLSCLFIGGYFIILGLMISGKITIVEGIKDMILLLIGMITREVPTIMQFWFGSSSGSKNKDNQSTNS